VRARQHQHRQSGEAPAQRFESGRAHRVRKAEVEQRDIEARAGADQTQRIGQRGGWLASDGVVERLEVVADRAAHQRVIVDDQEVQAHVAVRPGSFTRGSMVTNRHGRCQRAVMRPAG
jgi:hypothetical protein